MARKEIDCPRCGGPNAVSAERCPKCGIDLLWAREHWNERVFGPLDEHITPREAFAHRREHKPGTQNVYASLVLVSDNDPAMCYLLQLLLELAGYRVVGETDSFAALDLAERLRPDLITTDMMKPDIDGLEMIRRLKANAATRNIPVIVISARGTNEARTKALEVGASQYLSKPIEFSDLVPIVRSIIPSEPLILFIHDHLPKDALTSELNLALHKNQWCKLTFSNAKDFIVGVKRVNPDAIAIAFHIADANGLNLLAQLKADPDIGRIPVVMLADDPEPELERQAMELGAYSVYTGPLDADGLLAKLPPVHSPRTSPS